LPPLDGGRIAVSLLPHRLAYQFARLEPYGMIILMVLLFTGILGKVMMPIMRAAFSILSFVFGI
jgi:Zn-dependent protease